MVRLPNSQFSMKKEKVSIEKLFLKKEVITQLNQKESFKIKAGDEPPLQHPLPSWTTVLTVSLLVCSGN